MVHIDAVAESGTMGLEQDRHQRVGILADHSDFLTTLKNRLEPAFHRPLMSFELQ